jgi:hypothetical protein
LIARVTRVTRVTYRLDAPYPEAHPTLEQSAADQLPARALKLANAGQEKPAAALDP